MIKFVAFFLFLAWLHHTPEIRSVLNDLYRNGAFLDWRFLGALSLGMGYASFANWRYVRDLDDLTIYNFYSGRSSQGLRS